MLFLLLLLLLIAVTSRCDVDRMQARPLERTLAPGPSLLGIRPARINFLAETH